MKSTIDISNDLSIPLRNANVEWNLYVYKKRYKDKIINTYDVYKIDTISIDTLYSDIHNYLIKNFLNKLDVCDYSSEMPKNKIGFIDLQKDDNVLKHGLNLLNECISTYTQFASKDLALHGYVLECNINGQTYMKVLSSSNPIKYYKHKFSFIINNFTELTDPILSLNVSCDCIIFNDYALFFTGKAESIFDLEKHYKVLASKCLTQLQEKGIIEDFDSFKNYACCWPKAAKFESFDIDRINSFAELDIPTKAKILNNFSILLNSQGAIVANSPEEREQVLNFACGKLLIDFNNDGYEVAYPKKINPQ